MTDFPAVWSLFHDRPSSMGSEWPLVDRKHLGFFSSEELASKAIADAVVLEGFRENPEHFVVQEVRVGEMLYPDGFQYDNDRKLIAVEATDERPSPTKD